MKTLANCKPSEFLKQTNRIRKAVSKWLTDTDIISIRQRIPKYETVPQSASEDEKKEVIKKNTALLREQQRQNLKAIFDAMLDDHPDETLEVIALCCFIEPKDIDNHSIGELLQAVSSLISDEDVISFFTSLAQLAQTGILDSVKA